MLNFIAGAMLGALIAWGCAAVVSLGLKGYVPLWPGQHNPEGPWINALTGVAMTGLAALVATYAVNS